MSHLGKENQLVCWIENEINDAYIQGKRAIKEAIYQMMPDNRMFQHF